MRWYLPDAKIEKVATGFTFTEGPLWRPEGVLWFSDVPGNVVRSVSPAGEVKVIIPNAGGTVSAPPGAFIGPNGMIADKDGAVLLCQHGNRRIVRIGKDMSITPYLEKFEGHRFNSPNDLVYRTRRRAVFHRSAIRFDEAGRRSGEGTEVQRRVPV